MGSGLRQITNKLLTGTTFVFLVNGETEIDDQGRRGQQAQLTPASRDMAAGTRAHILRDYHTVQCAFSAPTKVSIETCTDPWWPTFALPELHHLDASVDPEYMADAIILEKAFQRLGATPMATYCRDATIKAALFRWLKRALDSLECALEKLPHEEMAIVITGQDTLLTLLACAMTLQVAPGTEASHLTRSMIGPAEALILNIRDSRVRLHSLRHAEAKYCAA